MRDIEGKFIKGHKLGFKKGYIPWNKGRNNWGIIINCFQCKKEIRIKRYRIKRSQYIHCSKECSNKTQDKGKSSLMQKIKASKKWKIWRETIFKRDNYTCQFCKRKGGELHPDHIKPKALYPELIFDINNGRTLCKDCHIKTPTYGKRYDLIKKY